MQLVTAYRGSSDLYRQAGGGQTLRLAPNLSRDPVAFDAPLNDVVRFREAISALHDVVVSDLRFTPRDKAAYEAFKETEQQRLLALDNQVYRDAVSQHVPVERDSALGFETDYRLAVGEYWRVRQKYSRHLRQTDPSLWRRLVPCDPVITVADDVVFFECFSADHSSYGCLTIDRDACFRGASGVQCGTTNVDYSWRLYEHLQSLRSYRAARLQVDPEGIAVSSTGTGDLREEKIDLPPEWLRGFMQIQVAMGLPMRRTRLSRDAVYNLLAWLKRNRAKRSPRAVRFELTPGHAPCLVLEPWEKRIESRGTFTGDEAVAIRIWGRRRLLVLARLLPILDHVDVYLLGDGLPSFWIARLGPLRLTLGLSGWITNHWSDSATSFELLKPPVSASDTLVAAIDGQLRRQRACTFEELVRSNLTRPAEVAAAIAHLADTGQVIYDLAAGVYRCRQVMPHAIAEAELGAEPPELVASRSIARGDVQIKSNRVVDGGLRDVSARIKGVEVHFQLDREGAFTSMQCSCGHDFRYRSRRGPCRHVLASRRVLRTPGGDSLRAWYRQWE